MGPSAASHYRLISLLPSMNAELIRWTLQSAAIPFSEQPHAPVFHLFAFKRLSVKAFYVALVVNNQRFADTSAIIAFLKSQVLQNHPLFAANSKEQGIVDDLWPQFHKQLGSAVARWIYAHMLPNKPVMREILTQGVPGFERMACRYGYSWLAGTVKKALKIGAQTSVEMTDQIQGVLDQTDKLLSDDRPYLLGDRFSIIDILFCANGAPCVLEPLYGAPLPTLQQSPSAMQQMVNACRERPSGQFIRRIYQQHRLAKTTHE